MEIKTNETEVGTGMKVGTCIISPSWEESRFKEFNHDLAKKVLEEIEKGKTVVNLEFPDTTSAINYLISPIRYEGKMETPTQFLEEEVHRINPQYNIRGSYDNNESPLIVKLSLL